MNNQANTDYEKALSMINRGIDNCNKSLTYVKPSADAVLSLIAQKSRENFRINPEDYKGNDGLMYCGKCHTPKEFFSTQFGKTWTLGKACDCMTEQARKEHEQLRYEQERLRISENRKKCFPDTELANWKFEIDDRTGDENGIMKKMRKYADSFEELYNDGCGVILYGNVGVGKSFAAACVANAVIDMGYSCYMTSFSREINTLWSINEKQKYIDDLNLFDLLVIDDLGVERDTPYASEVEMQIVDSRCKSGKPIIVTTNLTANELMNPKDIRKQRIYSRLFEMCLAYEYVGSDRRKAKMIAKSQKYKHLL